MQTGTIKSWISGKGFDFIQPDAGGPDLFVHITRVVNDIDDLRRGDRVQFEPGINPKNRKAEARDVKLIDA